MTTEKQQQLPEALLTAVSNYREYDEEYKNLGLAMDEQRAIIKREAQALGGKVKIPHVAAISIVPASESHSYDTDAIDALVLELFSDGTKEGVMIAGRLAAARKKTQRKETLRISLDKGW